jgi:putative ABC transport system permease protein
MFSIGLRDLQWRLRRFLIGVVATALVFSLTLVLGGITAFFHNETSRTVRAFNVDRWIVPAGVAGPFTSTEFVPDSDVSKVKALPGVADAAPMVLFRQTVRMPALRDLNIVGLRLGGLGSPSLVKGRLPQQSGELVVDRTFGAKIGTKLHILNRDFRVVGLTHGLTYFGGTPVGFMPLADAQELLFLGRPFASTIVTRGVPLHAPPTMQVITNDAVRADLYRPIKQASDTIQVVDILLWLIAAAIIGAILYMSSLERIKDFAVMKATGASNGFVLAGLLLQAVILAVGAAATAIVLARLLGPLIPVGVEIPASSYVVLLVIAVVVGGLGSIAGLRWAVTVDPALAFGA